MKRWPIMDNEFVSVGTLMVTLYLITCKKQVDYITNRLNDDVTCLSFSTLKIITETFL